MENASKALLIGGAILIAILLISLAVWIMGSIDPMKEQLTSTMTEAEISAFNSKFSGYIGTNRTSAQIKSLYELWKTVSVTNGYEVAMTIDGVEPTAITIQGLKSKNRYSVLVEDKEYEDGVYDTITVVTTRGDKITGEETPNPPAPNPPADEH